MSTSRGTVRCKASSGTPNPNPLLPPITIIQKPADYLHFNVNVINNTAYWSIEWMYVGRSQEIGDGGYLEWYAGPRYTELNDTFLVNANGGNLNATNWATDAQNHIIAGQLGARYFKKVGRWMLNTEGRFFGGINCQNIHQFGVIGSNLAPPGGLFATFDLGPRRLQPCRFRTRVHARHRIAIGTALPTDAQHLLQGRLVGNLDG